jgi:hypothetical protein
MMNGGDDNVAAKEVVDKVMNGGDDNVAVKEEVANKVMNILKSITKIKEVVDELRVCDWPRIVMYPRDPLDVKLDLGTFMEAYFTIATANEKTFNNVNDKSNDKAII